MFGHFLRLAWWAWDAVTDKAQTPEGGLELAEILNGLESEGIDVPFFDPIPQEDIQAARESQSPERPRRTSRRPGEARE